MHSRRAVLNCGEVYDADVVLLDDGRVCGVMDFWQEGGADDTVIARLAEFTVSIGDPRVFGYLFACTGAGGRLSYR